MITKSGVYHSKMIVFMVDFFTIHGPSSAADAAKALVYGRAHIQIFESSLQQGNLCILLLNLQKLRKNRFLYCGNSVIWMHHIKASSLNGKGYVKYDPNRNLTAIYAKEHSSYSQFFFGYQQHSHCNQRQCPVL